MANWKTTLFGIIAAAATGIGQVPGLATGKTGNIVSVIQVISIALLGLVSKDHNVTGGTTPNNPPSPSA